MFLLLLGRLRTTLSLLLLLFLAFLLLAMHAVVIARIFAVARIHHEAIVSLGKKGRTQFMRAMSDEMLHAVGVGEVSGLCQQGFPLRLVLLLLLLLALLRCVLRLLASPCHPASVLHASPPLGERRLLPDPLRWGLQCRRRNRRRTPLALQANDRHEHRCE